MFSIIKAFRTTDNAAKDRFFSQTLSSSNLADVNPSCMHGNINYMSFWLSANRENHFFNVLRNCSSKQILSDGVLFWIEFSMEDKVQ